MAETTSTTNLCGYPVEKAAAIGVMNVAVHLFHTPQAWTESQFSNTIRQRLTKEGAGQIGDERDENL